MTLSIGVSLLLGIALVRPVATAGALPSNWRVLACDVGQGDGVVLRGSQGVILIDTGIDGQKIRSCLDSLGIKRVDLLVLTHDDADHVGGLSGIVDRVSAALIAPNTSQAKSSRPVVALLHTSGVETTIGFAGLSGTFGDLSWQVVWPQKHATPKTTNEASVTLKVRWPEFSGIFLGDLGEDAQSQLLRLGNPGHVDVVKVSHHGSADQSAQLYESIDAEYGIISVGSDNRYGHPTSELLRILSAAGTLPLRTDINGPVAIARDSSGKWMLWHGIRVG